eukprot:2994211-Rhodomonas_salina.1
MFPLHLVSLDAGRRCPDAARRSTLGSRFACFSWRLIICVASRPAPFPRASCQSAPPSNNHPSAFQQPPVVPHHLLALLPSSLSC